MGTSCFGSRTAFPTRFIWQSNCLSYTILATVSSNNHHHRLCNSNHDTVPSTSSFVPSTNRPNTNSSLAMEVFFPSLPPNATATDPPDVAIVEPPAPNPIETYDRPWEPKVTYDLLCNYQATDLAATMMYLPKKTKPIVLSCMGFGVPLFPDVETDQPDNELWTELDHRRQVA